MLARSIGAAALLGGGFLGPVAAQVSIQVVDSGGRPIPAVRIDVFGTGELIGVDSTSAGGIAELSSERWSEVRRVSLTHFGFRTLIVQAGDIPADGVIRLDPEATQLEGLTVVGRTLCPIADEEHARRLWSEVASRYSADTGSRPWLAYFARYQGPVREEDLHRTPDSEATDYVVAGGPGAIHGGDQTPRLLDDRISIEGYAWPPLVIGGTTSGRELAWRYPELDRAHAYHFVSPVFGALHNFAMASESEGQTTLIFCGNEEERGATINGIIRLVPGETLLAAEWRFETGDPDEGAGGSVSFMTYVQARGLRPHLVASRGLFYRHSGAELRYPDLPRTYVRFGTANARWWYLNPSAERPCNTGLSFFLDPPRTPQGERFAECVADHFGRE